jgi:radical SAM superfamily enzyme YgiQ (UPF0313 family)
MLIPNHGLGYLATALRRAGHQVSLLDCIRDRVPHRRFAAHVGELAPDIIGFQVFTFDLNSVRQHLAALSDAGFSRPVIVGGPHPSADPEGTLAYLERVDYLCVGEADHALPRLVGRLEDLGFPRSLSSEEAQGLGPLRVRTLPASAAGPPEYIEDLDALGLPAWDLISPLSYPYAPQGTFLRRIPFAPIIVTRGCPFRCTFCAGHVVSGRRVRTRSVEHVIDELRFLVERFGIREFHVQDDNFTFDRDYVLRFCDALRTTGLDLVWACPNGVRLDTLDEEVVRAMENAGCYSIAVGIESGTQRVLDLMRKHLQLDEVRARLALIRRTTKMRITGFFVLGHPGETLAEMQRTIRLSRTLDIDKVNYGLLMPLPGTEVAQILDSRGLLQNIEWEKMSEYNSPYTPAGLDADHYRRMFRRAFIRFYARPRIMLRLLGEIRSVDQLRVLFRRFLDVISPEVA